MLYCEDPDGFHGLNLVWDIGKPISAEIKEFQLWEPKYLQLRYYPCSKFCEGLSHGLRDFLESIISEIEVLQSGAVREFVGN